MPIASSDGEYGVDCKVWDSEGYLSPLQGDVMMGVFRVWALAFGRHQDAGDAGSIPAKCPTGT